MIASAVLPASSLPTVKLVLLATAGSTRPADATTARRDSTTVPFLGRRPARNASQDATVLAWVRLPTKISAPQVPTELLDFKPPPAALVPALSDSTASVARQEGLTAQRAQWQPRFLVCQALGSVSTVLRATRALLDVVLLDQRVHPLPVEPVAATFSTARAEVKHQRVSFHRLGALMLLITLAVYFYVVFFSYILKHKTAIWYCLYHCY